jgi:hypothetical protein
VKQGADKISIERNNGAYDMDVINPKMFYRANFLKAARFAFPEAIPCRVIVTRPLVNSYREEFVEIVKRYPLAFPDYSVEALKFDDWRGVVYEDRFVKDVFGTVWRYRIKGLGPEPYVYPLADLDRVREWSLPDPEAGYPIGYADPKPMMLWEELFELFDRVREQGGLVAFSLHHFLFQKLMDLIPLGKLLYAIHRGDERFVIALEKVAEYQFGLLKVAKRYGGIDVVVVLEDLGDQRSPLIRPEHLRKYFLPYYKKLSTEVNELGSLLYFHSDGNVMPLADVLLDSGAHIFNIQDVVNGVDNIAKKLRGRVCIDIDVDRQHVIPFGSRENIFKHIENIVKILNSEKGGLALHIEVYPPTPLKNIAYLAEACYRYAFNLTP